MDQINELEKAIDDPYSEIPVLDLGPYLAGEKGALEDIGAKVRHIQETIGFWAVINHGVSWEKLERTYAQLKRFLPCRMTKNSAIELMSCQWVTFPRSQPNMSHRL